MKDYLRVTLLLTSVFLSTFLLSQENKTIRLDWKASISYGLEGEDKSSALNFENAQYDFSISNVPFYVERYEGLVFDRAFLRNANTVELTEEELSQLNLDAIGFEFNLKVNSVIIRRQKVSEVKIVPFRKNELGRVEKLISFNLETSEISKGRITRPKSLTFASQSQLATGEWYKVAVVKEGVFKLTSSFLRNLGVDLESIDPRKIKLYGYGGGMLPAANSEPRPDDMQENAIFVSGENDGVFDQEDYVLFYGEDQLDWSYDSTRKFFRPTLNLFSDTTFYFLRVDGSNGKRISKKINSGVAPITTITEYDGYAHHESEDLNLLKSGSLWLGELYDNVSSIPFSFNLPNVVTSEMGTIRLSALCFCSIGSEE